MYGIKIGSDALRAFGTFPGTVAKQQRCFATQTKNYYELLEVTNSATTAELKKAYFQLAKKYHPDVAGEEGESMFKQISEAYDVLKDPSTRQRYDESLKYGIAYGQSPHQGGYGGQQAEYDMADAMKSFNSVFTDLFTGEILEAFKEDWNEMLVQMKASNNIIGKAKPVLVFMNDHKLTSASFGLLLIGLRSPPLAFACLRMAFGPILLLLRNPQGAALIIRYLLRALVEYEKKLQQKKMKRSGK